MNIYEFISYLEKNKENLNFKCLRALIDGFKNNTFYQYSLTDVDKKFQGFSNWVMDYIKKNYTDDALLKEISISQDYIYHICLLRKTNEEQLNLFFQLVNEFYNEVESENK